MSIIGRKVSKEVALKQFLSRKTPAPKVTNKWLIRDKVDNTVFAYLLGLQKGVCAVCEKEETTVSKFGKIPHLSVDHCHNTGRIRGLLCYRCNRVLGSCEDMPSLLRRLADYIEQADTGFTVKLK